MNGTATSNPTPALCQVCGYNTAVDETAVRVIRNTKADGESTLALLCIRCWGAGMLWAAKQALEERQANPCICTAKCNIPCNGDCGCQACFSAYGG